MNAAKGKEKGIGKTYSAEKAEKSVGSVQDLIFNWYDRPVSENFGLCIPFRIFESTCRKKARTDNVTFFFAKMTHISFFYSLFCY